MRARQLLIAGLAVLGIAGGAYAGLDAGRTVDSFYTVSREPRYRAIEAPTRPPSARDAGTVTFAAAPSAGTVWGLEIGRDERSFFDTASYETTAGDTWAAEAKAAEPPVRVHRAVIRPVASAVEPPVVEDTIPIEEPVDGWVEAPADPDRLPSAG